MFFCQAHADRTTCQIIKGEMSDLAALEQAMAPCTAVLSLLGPNINNKNISPTLFSDMYKLQVFPVMRTCGIKRLIAMGTVSISHADDRFTLFSSSVQIFMWSFANAIYKNMQNLAETMEKEGSDLDWTLFRISMIDGEAKEADWTEARDSCDVFAGSIGESGRETSMPRAALTKWMVSNTESQEWYHKMPALSALRT